MCLLIQVEGARGMGKDTLCRALVEHLEEMGYDTHLRTNPTDSLYGESAIHRIAHGKNDLETAMLYCLDRIQSGKELVLPEKSVVVFNRYSLSTFAYQGMCSPEEYERKDYIWALAYIHRLIQRPYATILLDAEYNTWRDINHDLMIDQILDERRRRHGAQTSFSASTGDRSSLRKKDLASKETFEKYRQAYLHALIWLKFHQPELVGKTLTLQAFSPIENSLDQIMESFFARR